MAPRAVIGCIAKSRHRKSGNGMHLSGHLRKIRPWFVLGIVIVLAGKLASRWWELPWILWVGLAVGGVMCAVDAMCAMRMIGPVDPKANK